MYTEVLVAQDPLIISAGSTPADCPSAVVEERALRYALHGDRQPRAGVLPTIRATYDQSG